jgi:hypothetical protein
MVGCCAGAGLAVIVLVGLQFSKPAVPHPQYWRPPELPKGGMQLQAETLISCGLPKNLYIPDKKPLQYALPSMIAHGTLWM